MPYKSLPTSAGSAGSANSVSLTSRIGDPLSLFSSVSALSSLLSSTSEELFLLLRFAGSYLCIERRLFPLPFLPSRFSSITELLRRLAGDALRLMLRVSRRSLRPPRLSFLSGLGDALVLLRGGGLRLDEAEVDRDLDLELEL